MKIVDQEWVPTLRFIATLIAWIFLIIIFFWSYFTVSQWSVALTKTFWKLNDTVYEPWFNFKRPLIDSVVKFSIQTEKDQATAAAASKDLQNVTTEVAVNYNVDKSRVKDIYTNLGNMDTVKEKVVTPSIQEIVKAITSKYTAEELITKRNQISTDITDWLKNKLSTYWLNVVDVNIINFEFSEWFNAAIEAKVRVEQEALTQKNQLAKIWYEQDQKVIIAEADKKAAQLKADAIVITAKADAEATSLKSKAISQAGGRDYIQLKWIEQWDGKLPQYQLGWSTPLIQLPNN